LAQNTFTERLFLLGYLTWRGSRKAMAGPAASIFHSHTSHSTLTPPSKTWTPASTPNNTPRTPNSWQHGVPRWTLVWCHERSLKQECKTLRKMLEHTAQKYGAKLACMKKSHMFRQWLSTTKEPYVLFTDWREVKQCVEVMDLQGPECCPIFTSVFCIDERQHCRAERWVSTLVARKDPIYINGSLPLAESTVMSLLLQVSKVLRNDVQVPPILPLNQLMNGDVQTSCSFEVLHPTTYKQVSPWFEEVQPMQDKVQATDRPYRTRSSRTDVPILPLFELTRPKNGMQAHTVSQRTQLTRHGMSVPHAFQQTRLKENQVQALPLCVTKPANNPVAVVLHANPEVTDLQSKVTAHVAWIWESLVSSAEVEKALLMAMPESYEE